MPTAGATLVWTAVALALFPWSAGQIWTISIDVFCIGVVMSMTAIHQQRLLDVASDAQNLAAALINPAPKQLKDQLFSTRSKIKAGSCPSLISSASRPSAAAIALTRARAINPS